MSTFNDPENINKIIEDIKSRRTFGDLCQIVNDIFPGWIITLLPRYCDSYPHLTKNWHYMCYKNGIFPTAIVLVSYLSDDEEHRLMNIFLDAFYKGGFVVRLVEHFSPCPSCLDLKTAVPTKFMYDKFVENNIISLPLT